jgi:phospholipid-transporting ATPase
MNLSGNTGHFWDNGTMILGVVVLVCNLKILIFSNTISIMTVVSILGSLLIYLVSWLFIDLIPNAESYWVMQSLLSTPVFHIGNILIVMSTTMVDLAISLYIRTSILN